jgi:hypothetical protein
MDWFRVTPKELKSKTLDVVMPKYHILSELLAAQYLVSIKDGFLVNDGEEHRNLKNADADNPPRSLDPLMPGMSIGDPVILQDLFSTRHRRCPLPAADRWPRGHDSLVNISDTPNGAPLR